jgi:hypothetical protein
LNIFMNSFWRQPNVVIASCALYDNFIEHEYSKLLVIEVVLIDFLTLFSGQ